MYAGFCEQFIIGKSGRLLDVGCGLGFFVKALEPFQDWQTVGCEISDAAVQFARTRLGLANVMRLDKTGELDFPPNSFDIVTLWDVLEHLPCPDPLLINLRSILKQEGLLFLHTPNVQVQLLKARLKKLLKGMQPGLYYLEAKDHVHLYSMRSIRRLLERNGFSRVAFVHLPPIQGVAGSRSRFPIIVKNQWFWCAKAAFDLSFGLVNVDNLFVVAEKGRAG
jgi:SAM-dependent methyltransferase